ALHTRRPLVSGRFTGAWAAVSLGGVVLPRQAFRALSGHQTALAIVASTLAIAALFRPLRRRIQGAVDRRFYRRRYDAAAVLAAFGASARDEVDLGRLTGTLLAVVEESMRPAHASLWLRPPDRGAARVASPIPK